MARVDPFVIQWPQKWVEDPEIGPVINYLNRYLHDLFIIVTGGTGDSLIEDQNVRESFPWPLNQLAEETKEFTYPSIQIPLKSFNNITVRTNYTAVSFDFINAINGGTITFPKYPNENDVIIVRNGNGKIVSLNGNGKNLNGSPTGKLFRKSTSIEFHYFIDTDEWFAR